MFTFNIPPVDWELWNRMPEAHLWEVVAVSLDISPGASRGETTGGVRRDEYARRLRLSEANLGGDLPVVSWPGKVENHHSAYAVVRLTEFAAFAKRNGWTLPSRFPIDPVNWDVWSHMEKSELWQVVAVSLRLSPDGKTLDDAELAFSQEFKDRMRVAVNHLGKDLSVVEWFAWPETTDNRVLFAQMNKTPPVERSTVRLVDFAAWALGRDFGLPERFPRGKVTSEVWERKAPDWKLWAPMAFVELIQAVALSCDIDPSGIVRPLCDDSEFLRRLQIANNQWLAGNIPHVDGPGSEVPGNQLRYVRLPDFARLANSLEWSMPAEFPRTSVPVGAIGGIPSPRTGTSATRIVPPKVHGTGDRAADLMERMVPEDDIEPLQHGRNTGIRIVVAPEIHVEQVQTVQESPPAPTAPPSKLTRGKDWITIVYYVLAGGVLLAAFLGITRWRDCTSRAVHEKPADMSQVSPADTAAPPLQR